MWRQGSQKRLGCPKSGHRCPGSGHEYPVGASPEMSWGGEASDGASPYESRRQPRGVLGWWSECVGFSM